MTTQTLTDGGAKGVNWYSQPFLGAMLIVFMFSEKMLAHTYTGLTIYVIPQPWNYLASFLGGAFGVWLVIKGLGRDEVKGSLLGYLGGAFIWMSWVESSLPVLARYDQVPMVPAAPGTPVMSGMNGEHVILQASGVFCLIALMVIMFNKDMRCRMLLWIRRKLGMGAKVVGVPAKGYRPNVARVAAFEYFFVTWFMYIITLWMIDPRLLGLKHPVIVGCFIAMGAWGCYLMYRMFFQREVGMAIRYGIGALGVAWFIPEALQLHELFYEFYLFPQKHPIAMLILLACFLFPVWVLWKTPVNEKTGQSA